MNAGTSNTKIAVWLLCGCFLIFSMVVIGGITRLTGSGLSITEWNVIMGALPPLNDQEWQLAFEKYQQIPQYKEVNSFFTLSDFKSIFWWEYFHRLVGRLIGVVFLVPFLWFLFTRQLERKMVKKAIFLFCLGGLQGFLGWFMVKSGLSERTSVSHIRLAIHLTTAFVTFAFTFWFALQLLEKKSNIPHFPSVHRWSIVLLIILLIQLVYGAFVAGLHAGKMFNTFPLMNGQIYPTGGWVDDWGIRNLVDNPATVQFIHRFFAFSIVSLTGLLSWRCKSLQVSIRQQRSIRFLMLTVIAQFLLGVFTVLYQAPIALSSVHQIGAFFLFMAVLLTVFRFRQSTNSPQ